ncbi:DcaP family trimeric outer membrane transporter [Acinetobacter shaoyimingii]|uniref:TMF family protein n=1 Tax=Acinetobacter shaoyimingii TaxID=2715164 RepID=A0A6G8RV84_9GAMM|nr:DcaP family trimeric outer membrane transporter [Acinetobacter shaoyimingii]QIO05849.1 TMF family protein [Acinetobacter shaoyimingii]
MKVKKYPFNHHALAIALLGCISPVYAASNAELEAKVDQLQKQVQMLTEMMTKQNQQQQLDQQQIQQLAQVNKDVVAQVQTQQKNIDSNQTIKVKSNSEKTDLQLKPLVTKNGAELELYGNIRADASYQVKGPGTMYNSISTVPLKGSAGEKNNTDKVLSTLNATRFGFNFKAPKTWNHDVGGKLEMDFFGGAGRDTFRIRHAYMTFDQWLVGQTWSNFNVLDFFPETVDASLSVGGSLTRVPQIKYSHDIDKKTSMLVSLEDQKSEIVTTTGTQNIRTDPYAKVKLPSLTGRINYKFDNGSIISGRAFMTQKSTSYGGSDDFLAWGVAAGGKIQITPKTTFKIDYSHIYGDTKNVLWSNYAYVFDDNAKIHPNEFDAVTVGLTQQFTPKIRSTLGFGYSRANTGNTFADLVRLHNDQTQNKELMEGWINLFYTPIKPINIGVEYMYGQRKTFDDKTGENNRFNITAIYDF